MSNQTQPNNQNKSDIEQVRRLLENMLDRLNVPLERAPAPPPVNNAVNGDVENLKNQIAGLNDDDIWISSGESLPFFGDVNGFCAYIKAQPNKKRYLEWNGRVYYTGDVLYGYFDGMGLGRINDFLYSKL